jgi:putative nucleotidyltransferase with HDIG domain
MTSAALDWLRQMNGAVSVRYLYPAEHPRAVAVVRALEEATHKLTADRAETSLFVVEGRLACEGELVPGSDGIAAKTFDALRAHGFDRITIRRGVTADELARLVNALAVTAKSGTASEPIQSSLHVRLSVLDTAARESLAPKASQPELLAAVELPQLWKQIDENRSLNIDALETILAPLVTAVGQHEDSMLPLASLRSHDEYTATHVTNVAVLTMALAQAARLPPATVREVGIAALLHDIGKMKVPTDILTAPGRLTPEQHVMVRRHPEMGARMLLETPGVPQLAVLVAYEHHLQADGGGYPSVPSGWRVNLASEMTHVADVYDALRTNRPYRAGLDQHAVFETMQRDRGAVFSEGMLDLFFARVMPRTRPADGGRRQEHASL